MIFLPFLRIIRKQGNLYPGGFIEMGDKKVKSALLAFSVLLILSSGCGITVTRNYYFVESGLEDKKTGNQRNNG